MGAAGPVVTATTDQEVHVTVTAIARGRWQWLCLQAWKCFSVAMRVSWRY